jgi:hypothetical protein
MDMNNFTASEPVVSEPVDHDDESLQERPISSQKRTEKARTGRKTRARNRTNGIYACKVEGCRKNAFGCREDLNIHHFGVHMGLTKVNGSYHCLGHDCESSSKLKIDLWKHFKWCPSAICERQGLAQFTSSDRMNSQASRPVSHSSSSQSTSARQ